MAPIPAASSSPSQFRHHLIAVVPDLRIAESQDLEPRGPHRHSLFVVSAAIDEGGVIALAVNLHNDSRLAVVEVDPAQPHLSAHVDLPHERQAGSLREITNTAFEHAGRRHVVGPALREERPYDLSARSAALAKIVEDRGHPVAI